LLYLGFEGVFGDRSQTGERFAVLTEFLYFAALEGWFGWSPGKLALRLRVCPADGTEPPPWRNLLLRTAIFVAAVHAHTLVELLAPGLEPVAWLAWLGAVAAIVAPMRGRNGYRGLHERASGTHVVQLPWPAPRHRIE